MPPRYAYWTILIDKGPTAFRARDKDDLLPTLNQLRRTNKDVELKWFARGRPPAQNRGPRREGPPSKDFGPPRDAPPKDRAPWRDRPPAQNRSPRREGPPSKDSGSRRGGGPPKGRGRR